MPVVDPSKLLTSVNPTLAAQWHPTRNTILSLETVYANSGKQAHWQCSTCNYEWEATVASRNRGNGCPNCAGKIANPTNSLISLHPHIAAEYHPTLNSKAVETLTAISHYKAWWQCPTNPEHTWQAAVQNRVRQGDGCPYCSGRYPTKENNLAVVYPEIAAEFDLEANAPLTPYDFTPGSNKTVHWKCSQGHTWRVSVNSRVRGGQLQNCSVCVGKIAGPDSHLGITHPYIAAEYHPTLNDVPISRVRKGSAIKRWWQCSTNPEHVWESRVASRTRTTSKGGCPQCSPTPRTSKIEQDIKELLREDSVLTDIPETYNAFIPLLNGRKAAVDIYGLYGEMKVVIEYDSWYWHSGAGSGKSYDIPSDRDIRKTKDLLNSGYRVVRIREITHTQALPFLELDNPHLHQLGWKQSEGLDVLLARIKSCITA